MASTKPKVKKTPRKPRKQVVEIGKVDDDDSKPGCVYLGHIPHGFYEGQMRQYFTQFGKVLDVKICRSKKTNNSKGYGFVKFKFSAVAKTVAETCHNYLFLNKLLKCEYKPMTEIHKNTFKKVFKPINVHKSQQNNAKSDYKLAVSAKHSISKAEKKLEKLKASGHDLDLSDIMDVPDVSKINDAIVANKPTKVKPAENKKEDKSDTTSTTTPEIPAAKRRKTESAPSTPSVTSEKVKKLSKKPSDVSESPVTPKSKASTPKSASKKKTPVSQNASKISTPKSVTKKTNKVSDSPKASKVSSTPKSASKKKTPVSQKASKISTPKSVTKKTNKVSDSPVASKVSSTPKSATKANTGLKIKGKKSPKTPTNLTTPGSRKRKRV